ncbi:MAG: hypothetical protein LBH48_08625 [Bifidobacteriaceae bacterium]|nr:hypothetical protein [Bifidobacteriaceae bacterium]
MLEDAGYIAEQDGKWHATPAGRILARIYAERDILIAQGVRTGVWDALAPADLAGVVTALVFETKEGPASSVVPDSMRAAVKATNALAVELGERERHAGVPVTEPPDTSASTAVAMWARGEPLARVIDENLSPGDFVRLASQLLDVLDQIADVAPNPELRSCARQAFRAVRRGVVLTSIP